MSCLNETFLNEHTHLIGQDLCLHFWLKFKLILIFTYAFTYSNNHIHFALFTRFVCCCCCYCCCKCLFVEYWNYKKYELCIRNFDEDKI